MFRGLASLKGVLLFLLSPGDGLGEGLKLGRSVSHLTRGSCPWSSEAQTCQHHTLVLHYTCTMVLYDKKNGFKTARNENSSVFHTSDVFFQFLSFNMETRFFSPSFFPTTMWVTPDNPVCYGVCVWTMKWFSQCAAAVVFSHIKFQTCIPTKVSLMFYFNRTVSCTPTRWRSSDSSFSSH